ncbi:hypothetical protein [Tsukamurella sp. USMM236]|uniref:hypothetical protein n=1 Tax=Tsukamurella sp. USMM236 TaxID=3081301 RepID=UPI003015C69A
MGILSSIRVDLEELASKTAQIGKELDEQSMDLYRTSAQLGADGDDERAHAYRVLAESAAAHVSKLRELGIRVQQLGDSI